MKEFPSYVFVWLVFFKFEIVHFFLSPLANYKSMEEPRKKNGTHEHFFPSHHSIPRHTVYKPSWYMLMHKMFIYDSISSRSCIHSLQFFSSRSLSFFSHFESNLNSTICPSGDFSHLLLDLMPSLTLLAVCVCACVEMESNAQMLISKVLFFPRS